MSNTRWFAVVHVDNILVGIEVLFNDLGPRQGFVFVAQRWGNRQVRDDLRVVLVARVDGISGASSRGCCGLAPRGGAARKTLARLSRRIVVGRPES